MTKILNVKLRIDNLPKLQKQKQNNEKVYNLSIKMEEAFNDLKECLNSRRSVLIVFPNANLKKITDANKQTKKQVALLLVKLQENLDEIGTSETNQKVIRIRERNDEAKEQIQKEWKNCIEEELDFFSPLLEIVRSLPGYESLVTSFNSIQNRTLSPPSTHETALKLKTDINNLRDSLGKLKLDGPGGNFLKDAVNGRAVAKDLLNKEIQDFLETNGLWKILTIKVGK